MKGGENGKEGGLGVAGLRGDCMEAEGSSTQCRYTVMWMGEEQRKEEGPGTQQGSPFRPAVHIEQTRLGLVCSLVCSPARPNWKRTIGG
jgi:hypothetical protein